MARPGSPILLGRWSQHPGRLEAPTATWHGLRGLEQRASGRTLPVSGCTDSAPATSASLQPCTSGPPAPDALHPFTQASTAPVLARPWVSIAEASMAPGQVPSSALECRPCHGSHLRHQVKNLARRGSTASSHASWQEDMAPVPLHLRCLPSMLSDSLGIACEVSGFSNQTPGCKLGFEASEPQGTSYTSGSCQSWSAGRISLTHQGCSPSQQQQTSLVEAELAAKEAAPLPQSELVPEQSSCGELALREGAGRGVHIAAPSGVSKKKALEDAAHELLMQMQEELEGKGGAWNATDDQAPGRKTLGLSRRTIFHGEDAPSLRRRRLKGAAMLLLQELGGAQAEVDFDFPNTESSSAQLSSRRWEVELQAGGADKSWTVARFPRRSKTQRNDIGKDGQKHNPKEAPVGLEVCSVDHNNIQRSIITARAHVPNYTVKAKDRKDNCYPAKKKSRSSAPNEAGRIPRQSVSLESSQCPPWQKGKAPQGIDNAPCALKQVAEWPVLFGVRLVPASMQVGVDIA